MSWSKLRQNLESFLSPASNERVELCSTSMNCSAVRYRKWQGGTVPFLFLRVFGGVCFSPRYDILI